MVFAVYGPSLPHRESFTGGVRCPPEVLRMMRKIKSHEKRKVAIIRPSLPHDIGRALMKGRDITAMILDTSVKLYLTDISQ